MSRKPLIAIEQSLQTTYRKYIWSPFVKAIKEYNLISPGDTIGVAISGGKDSLLMAKLFAMYQRHSDIPFKLVFLSMDPGFNAENKSTMVANCEHLGLDVHYYDSDIFEVVDRISQEYPCYMCARMRRGFLYKKASELGCTKLALGHHFDDVIETTLINMFYGGSFKTMLPKVQSQDDASLHLIRPLYLVREQSIKSFIRANGIPAMNCGCAVAAGHTSSKRKEIKLLIATLKSTHPNIDQSIFKAAQNVNLDAVLGFSQHGKHYRFDDPSVASLYKGDC